MKVRGIRGAVTVKENSAAEIVAETEKLLRQMASANQFSIDDIASVIFSVTHDLNKEFPATAARNIGWGAVPLLCTNEINVPGSLPKCIRVLIHINTERAQSDIKHVYLGEARKLRPDIKTVEEEYR